MKSTTLIPAFVLLFVTTVPVLAQWESFKFGKISNQEMELQLYANDISANAFVLYHDGYTSYQYLSNEFQVLP